jgi:acyl-coenzyme A thioesterase PaaI-like protein
MARAHCYKVTRSIAFVRAVAYEDDPEDPVATAQATFMLDSSAGKKPGANLKPSRAARGRRQ